jgi:glycine hydroxymethyltransferase
MIDKAVFPGLQGGPHENVIASMATCLQLAQGKAWGSYARLVIDNARALAQALQKLDYKIIADGTDNHLMVIDLTNKKISGKEAEERLAKIGILVSRSTIPADPRPPYNPSGIRLGTLAITTRSFKTKQMPELASLIDQALQGQALAKVKTAVRALAKKIPSAD